jgi:hypothetical protein
MKVDFHVHTNRSVDAVHTPREMVKQAKKTGLDAIAITDHNQLFPAGEARRLTREFGLVVIPGIEGGNIAVQKHWIALGISRQINRMQILEILASIRQESGLSIPPPPHGRLGFGDYAGLGFNAVESLNGSEPASNRQVKNDGHIPEVAGSDSHALPMLGFCWTEVEADGTIDSILEAVRRGRCRPAGSTIPLPDYLRFYFLYLRYRILREPTAAYAAARKVIRDIRRVRAYESSCQNCRTHVLPR